MKLLITAGHNWWVVMPNFVLQERSLGEDLMRVAQEGPQPSGRHHGLPRPKMGKLKG